MKQNLVFTELDDGGWRPIADLDNYSMLVGPFLERADGEPCRIAIATDERHRNRNGTVHGGVLLTLADKAVALAARHGREDWLMATVQLSHQFIRRVMVGDFVEARGETVQTTSSLIFVNTVITVRGAPVGSASGIFSHRGGAKAGR